MEQLIRDLNSPQNQGRPDAINTIQRQLQRLQRESAAWQTGLDLLDTQDQLLQFYGALTISLKVNADWEQDRVADNRKQVSQLIEHLVTVYVRLAISSDSEVVISKLSSTLAAVFAKPDAAWAHPCRHVLACLLAGQYIPENQAPATTDMFGARTTLSGHALKSVLRLALALYEELGSNSKSQSGHRGELQLSNNAPDVWRLLQFTITVFCTHLENAALPSPDFHLHVQASRHVLEKTLVEALQQMPAWSKYVSAENSPPFLLFDLFQSSLRLVLRLLDKLDYAEHCMPCLTSLQNDHHRLLGRAVPDYRSQVNSSTAVGQWITNMCRGEYSPESNSYVDFLEAVISQLDCTTDEYLRDNDVIVVLERIQLLTRCQGAAMVEDEVCQTVLEMMSTIAEGYSDWSEPSQFDESMISLIRDVCLATVVKVQYPADELDKQTSTWEEDDFTRFEDYRFQAKDFLETAFGILGPPLVEEVAQAVSASSSPSWSEFEAALFVLTAVSDALSNDPDSCDPSLNQLLSSKSWTQAVTQSVEVPDRARRSIIRLLAETTSYLQRNPQYMISSLDFLFRSLQIKGHSNHAARAIFNLCDSQRSFLVQALPQFLETITTLEHIPLHSRCKVLSGVAALIQSLPSEEDRIVPLQKILQLIQNFEESTINLAPAADEEVSSPLFERVSMLAAIAKGLQSPADTPIDLDGTIKDNANYWTNGPGKLIQQQVMQMLSEPWGQLLISNNGDLVAAACDFLRAGYKEQMPSPLKFSSSTSAELLCTMIDLRNPNLDQTMNTASCFVSSTPSPNSTSSSEAESLITRVLAITKEATEILSDTGKESSFSAPTSILDFFNRSFPKYGLYILTHSSVTHIMTTIFEYAILLLKSTTDTLPRRSAAAFFTSFLDFTEPTSEYMQTPVANANLTAVLDKYSPTILGMNLHLLAGECARSETESMAVLLRAFISKQSLRAKRILQEAIKPESGVLTQKALDATKPEQRSRFVAQVESLRGARKTNEIVRDFWISCKGGQFGYVT